MNEDPVHDTDSVVQNPALTDEQRAYIRTRWLEQVTWMDAKAKLTQRRYVQARIVSLAGSAFVTGLLATGYQCDSLTIRMIGVIASLIVGLAVGFEELFHFGERWRHYRRNAELLKSEGLRFTNKVPPYVGIGSQEEAYGAFVERVEAMLADDVTVYIDRFASAPAGSPPPIA